MKFTDWLILITFLVAFIGLGIIVPAYCTYIIILHRGLLTFEALGMILLNSFASYSAISFLKENWEKAWQAFLPRL